MRFLPGLFILTAIACAGVEKPIAAPDVHLPEVKPALSEAETFASLTEMLAKHPALAGYTIKAQLGKLVWEGDRQKEAASDAEDNIADLTKVLGEIIDLSAAQHELAVSFKRSIQNTDGTPRTFDMEIKIQPPPKAVSNTPKG